MSSVVTPIPFPSLALGKSSGTASSVLAAGSGKAGVGPSQVPNQERVFLVEGIRPIPQKVVERARAWQFVNLAELIPNKPYSPEDEMSLLQQAQAEGKIVLVQSVEQLKRARKQITDIVSWLEAFGTLMAIVAPIEPSAIPHMVSHMLRVVRASRVSGSRWIEFDKEYRLKAVAQGNHKWSSHDADLWDYYVTTATAVQAQGSSIASGYGNQHPRWGAQQSDQSRTMGKPSQRAAKRGRGAEGSQTTQPWKKRACYSLNFDGACKKEAEGFTCPFLHVCYTCGAEGHLPPNCPDRGLKKKRE